MQGTWRPAAAAPRSPGRRGEAGAAREKTETTVGGAMRGAKPRRYTHASDGAAASGAATPGGCTDPCLHGRVLGGGCGPRWPGACGYGGDGHTGRSAERSGGRRRVQDLCGSVGRRRMHVHPVTVPATLGGQTEYLIHFDIGTPLPQRVALTLDTGSDLIWTQCAPCNVCFPQPFPVFNPSASNTFRRVACSSDYNCPTISNCNLKTHECSYHYSYGDNSSTSGTIARDTFTFKAPNGKGGTVAVPELGFGCGRSNTGLFSSNESGIAGFGRGPLSLPSQLKVNKFSYCFTRITTMESKTSPVFLGTPDNLKAHATGPIQSTPFVRNPANTYYYLSFKGVTVGKTRLPVHESAFALKGDSSGGTIIDSGTSITSFPQAVFGHLRSAFVSQVPLPVSNSSGDADSILCFSVASAADAKKVPVPKLVFHLESADLDLPRENYMVVDESELCVVIRSAGSDEMTIIGNFQQQNIHIVYDLESNKLVFVPAQCDKL